MAQKTRLQIEKAEKKAREKLEKKASKKGVTAEELEKEKEAKKLSFKAKRVIALVCGLFVAALILIIVGKSSNNKTIEEKNTYNIDNKYTIDDLGEVTFLNGDDIIKALPTNYKMKIKTSDTNGSNDYIMETKDGVFYYHGTENNDNFDEVHVMTEEMDLYLKNDGTNYEETNSIHHAYINAKSIVETILCGDNIKKDDDGFASTIEKDLVDTIFPTDIVISNVEDEGNAEEDEDAFYEPELLKTSIYIKDGNIYISGKGKDSKFDIEISKIKELSKDFSGYTSK